MQTAKLSQETSQEFHKKFPDLYFSECGDNVLVGSKRSLSLREHSRVFEDLIDYFYLNQLFQTSDLWVKSPGRETVFVYPAAQVVLN